MGSLSVQVVGVESMVLGSNLLHSLSGRLPLCNSAWCGFRKSCSQGTVCTKQSRGLRWMRARPLPSSRNERSPSQRMPRPCKVSE